MFPISKQNIPNNNELNCVILRPPTYYKINFVITITEPLKITTPGRPFSCEKNIRMKVRDNIKKQNRYTERHYYCLQRKPSLTFSFDTYISSDTGEYATISFSLTTCIIKFAYR